MRYHEMTKALDLIITAAHQKGTRDVLQGMAERLIQERRIRPLDRLARRKKQALVCWFCENCPDLLVNPQAHARSLAMTLGGGQSQAGMALPIPLPPPDLTGNGIQAAPSSAETKPPSNIFASFSVEDLLSDWFWDTK
jgi:hypothetical protein